MKTAPTQSRGGARRNRAIDVIPWLIAAVLGAAGLLKLPSLLDPGDAVGLWRDVLALSRPLSIAVVLVELGVSLALCFRTTRLRGLYGAGIILSSILMFRFVHRWSRPDVPCGCFGALGAFLKVEPSTFDNSVTLLVAALLLASFVYVTTVTLQALTRASHSGIQPMSG